MKLKMKHFGSLLAESRETVEQTSVRVPIDKTVLNV